MVTPRVLLLVTRTVTARRRRAVPRGRSTGTRGGGIAAVLVRTVGQPRGTGRRRVIRVCSTTVEVLLRLDVETRVRQTAVVVASYLCDRQPTKRVLTQSTLLRSATITITTNTSLASPSRCITGIIATRHKF